ncbi:MAG TPA: aminopeptidase P family protein [Rhabdochlamydiaceae bacterium]|nr:aminopeptidase P family protein [Rhabdochlamydiaceae bacterium]
MPLKTFLNRVSKLQMLFKTWKADGCLIEAPLDLFYFTGLQLSLGILIVLPSNVKLFVDGRYIEFAKKNSPFPVEHLSHEAVSAFLRPVRSLVFDTAATTVLRDEQLKKMSSGILKGVLQPTRELRLIKDAHELRLMKKSAAVVWRGYEHIRRSLKVGVTEKEVAFSFEVFCRKHGAEKLSFDPIIAFGKNSAYPHYRAGDEKLKKGQIVLIDIGVVVDHYHSDMTRTVFFGKPDPRLVLLETVVKKAHDAALKLCREGTKVGDLDKAARQIIERAGLQELILHSLGHGIGLETHEFPRLKFKGEDQNVILQEGMVITIEPGLYLPGAGGVRYEDTIVITSKGYMNFYA